MTDPPKADFLSASRVEATLEAKRRPVALIILSKINTLQINSALEISPPFSPFMPNNEQLYYFSFYPVIMSNTKHCPYFIRTRRQRGSYGDFQTQFLPSPQPLSKVR